MVGMIRTALLCIALLGLAACAGMGQPGQVPVSGVTGDRGGAISTIYYDAQGNAHFRS